jgi:hypothetical protein
MIKYQIQKDRKSRVSTSQVGGKRIVLKPEESEKIISFTDYKKFEKSLESLKASGIITITKLIGEKAKEAKIFVEEEVVTVPEGSEADAGKVIETSTDETPDDSVTTEGSTDETPDDSVTTEGSTDDVDKAPEVPEEDNKVPEGDDADKTDSDETEGSDDETKAPDSDVTDSSSDSDANATVDETKNAPATTQVPQQNNQGGRNNKRNRNRNR